MNCFSKLALSYEDRTFIIPTCENYNQIAFIDVYIRELRVRDGCNPHGWENSSQVFCQQHAAEIGQLNKEIEQKL